MFKKIIVIVLLVGLVGILLVGAVNRTLAKAESEGTGQGRGRQGNGLSEGDLSSFADDSNEQGLGNEGTGWGRGRLGFSGEDLSLSTGSNSYAEAGKNGGYQQGRGEVTDSHEFTPAGQGELSEADKEALIFMREEEKLAHDLYAEMYELWGLQIFQNIGSSEQSHTEAIKTLLDAYDIPDPASDVSGVFTDPDLQNLYNDLVVQGNQSLAEALKVGALIEEIDILDLQDRLAQTDNADIQQVFTNLLRGSSNHLRAYTSTLMTQTGETYQPQFMSADAYQSIIGESIVSGGQGRGFKGGRGGRP